MGFDGIRVDAARSVPKDWLEDFELEMGVPTFGEVFVGDIDYVSEYQDYEWGVLDFPFFFNVRGTFAADTNMNSLGDLFDNDYKYNNPNRLETFIDNHDRARFLTWADDNYQRLRSALSFMMTARGVPVIYYGTEQADNGNGNPYEVPIANKDNRKDMESFDQTGTIYEHIQRLTEIKAANPPLQIGTQREMWSDTQVYGFSRRVDGTGAGDGHALQRHVRPADADDPAALRVLDRRQHRAHEPHGHERDGDRGIGWGDRQADPVTLSEHETAVYTQGSPVSSYSLTGAARSHDHPRALQRRIRQQHRDPHRRVPAQLDERSRRARYVELEHVGVADGAHPGWGDVRVQAVDQ